MLERRVDAFLRAHCGPGERILVAVSGGRDSCVLLHALARRAPQHGQALAVAHVDHGLRGVEGRRDAAFVRATAAALGVPHFERAVEPDALRQDCSHALRPTRQEAARTLRYEALRAMADAWEADWIATAHHADDQAETVLMALLRGCGPHGLAGIPPVCRERRLLRPLLDSPGSELLAWAQRHGLRWREDASNQSPAYTRNRVRAWLPMLAEEFNPRLLRALAQLAEAQRGELEWTEPLVLREVEARLRRRPEGIAIETAGFAGLPAALARRVARRLLAQAGLGRVLSRRHLDRVVDFLGRGRRARGRVLELPAGVRLRHDGQRVELSGLPVARQTTRSKGRGQGEVLVSEGHFRAGPGFPRGEGDA